MCVPTEILKLNIAHVASPEEPNPLAQVPPMFCSTPSIEKRRQSLPRRLDTRRAKLTVPATKLPANCIRALLPSMVVFDFRLHAEPKNESVATDQPAPAKVQPVNGSLQPGGKLSASASLMATVATALAPPGTPIDTPPAGASSATLSVFGPSSIRSCKICTVITLLPDSPLAQVSVPDCATKSAPATALPATVAKFTDTTPVAPA